MSFTSNGPSRPRHQAHHRMRSGASWALLAIGLMMAGGAGMVPALALAAEPGSESQAGKVTVERILRTIVKVRSRVPDTARTSRNLGTEREGSGVVIGANGLILTIGYIILEAATIDVTDHGGRHFGAEFVAYDHRSGFGLIRVLRGLDLDPLKLGDSARLKEKQVVMVASHGGAKAALPAVVVSRRPFAGSWEYLLERAIFTAPPHFNWGGAALIDTDGKLVGVGSLAVGDAVKDQAVPGNMFVPINLLKPILKDLVATGRSSAKSKPWLGMRTEEVRGRLFVTRTPAHGPARAAGIKPGDIVLAIAGKPVTSMVDLFRKVWALGDAGVDVPVKVLQGAEIRDFIVHSSDRYKFLNLRPTY